MGKSTLFNRITGTRRSIVTPVAGTTRDVIAQAVEWQNVSFTLLDTGGMYGATDDPLRLMVAEKGKRRLPAPTCWSSCSTASTAWCPATSTS